MEPTGVTFGVLDDPVTVIIDEVSRLSAAEILALIRGYPRDPAERRARSHILDLAGARDGRRDDARRLKAAAAAAVQRAAAASKVDASLARLGALTDAELAVQDAVLAVFLADRLGRDQVELLSRPWQDVR